MIFLGILLPACISASGNSNVFTFSDTSVTAASEGSGYEIDGTDLTINATGTYTLTGSCAEGSVTVKKYVTGVTLVLDGLTLASSEAAPVSCGKFSSVTIEARDENTLTNTEDASTEETSDTFEGAAITVKSGASPGLKSAPDADDTESDGTLTINGGSFTLDIYGGSWYVNAGGHALDANGDINFHGGVTEFYGSANGNAALDYNGSCTYDGGTFLAGRLRHGADAFRRHLCGIWRHRHGRPAPG